MNICYSFPSLFNMLFFYWHSLIFITKASITIQDLYPISICLYESYSWTNFFTTSKHICTASYRKCPSYPLPFFHYIQGLMQCVASWRLPTIICSGSIHNKLTKFYSSCTVVIVFIEVLTFNQIGILFAVKNLLLWIIL